MDYQRRVIDDEVDELFASLPAISLEGARGVGKTETARRRCQMVFALDDVAATEILAANSGVLDTVPHPVLIDEWQRYPPVWDRIRRRVDDGAAPGSYLLTGSAVPTEAPVHSGAGRIVALRMRPLALSERGLSTPTVSISTLLTGTHPPVSGQTSITLTDYVDEILASGFPGIRGLAPRSRRAQLDGYLTRIVERDFPEQGLQVRRPETLRAWLAAYAAATATTASYTTILDAATAGLPNKPAASTTLAYRDVLAQLYILDPVPAWVPTRNRLGKAAATPKHHLADPALAARLLGIDAAALLSGATSAGATPRDGTLLGALFESLVTLSTRTWAQAAEARVHHYRTRDGAHEADLIVERGDGKVLALEVKLSAAADAGAVRHLSWLRTQLGDDLLDAAVITSGVHAYRRADGIAVIPAALLGP